MAERFSIRRSDYGYEVYRGSQWVKHCFSRPEALEYVASHIKCLQSSKNEMVRVVAEVHEIASRWDIKTNFPAIARQEEVQ